MNSKSEKDPFVGMRGQVGMGLVFFFFFGLALSSLAMDAGSIFIKKGQAQKIMDNAVLNGVAKSVNGADPEATEILVTQWIQHQADKQNISLSGLVVTASVSNTATGAKTEVQAQANVTAPVVMFKFIDATKTSWIFGVKTAAQTTRTPVILSMVIDRTGSMGTTSSTAPTGDWMYGSLGSSKIDKAKMAAARIVQDVLINVHDQMALISYAESATVNYPMCSLYNNNNKSNIIAKIGSLNTAGATNIASGVVAGRNQITAVTPASLNLDPSLYKRIIILLTDGMANVMTTTFTKPRPGIDPNDQVIFQNPISLRLAETFINGEVPYRTYFFGGRGVPACRDTTTSPNNLNRCLEDSVHTDSQGQDIGALTLQTTTASETDKEILGRAWADLIIREADYAKDWNSDKPDQRITIYTIGLGNHHDPGTDPYERDASTDKIRGVMLRKVANDLLADHDPKFDSEGGTSNYNPNQLSGNYYETGDPNKLFEFFKKIILDTPILLTDPS